MFYECQNLKLEKSESFKKTRNDINYKLENSDKLKSKKYRIC